MQQAGITNYRIYRRRGFRFLIVVKKEHETGKIKWQNLNKDVKVLIVGAGPAGLMMACQLSLFNIPFRIIDKKSSPSNYSGALIIHAKTLELLQQLELADTALKPGTQINALSIYFTEEKIHRLELKNTGKNLSQFTSMLMLEQAKTEELLLQFLKKKIVLLSGKQN